MSVSTLPISYLYHYFSTFLVVLCIHIMSVIFLPHNLLICYIMNVMLVHDNQRILAIQIGY
jgi:hypothetical protein